MSDATPQPQLIADEPITESSSNTATHTWFPLRLFNYYRIILATLFCLLSYKGPAPAPLGSSDLTLFFYVSLAYLLFATGALALIRSRRPGFTVQLFAHVLADILALTLLMHASGGISSGIGVLMVVSVANGGMISAGRTAGLFAALATIAVLIEQTYTLLVLPEARFSYPHAGFLGITLFTTAILAHVLARRARESEALAKRRGVDLANMAQLTEYIIQHMRTGVMVVDHNQRVRLQNAAARDLFGKESGSHAYLPHLSADLAERLNLWRSDQRSDTSTFRLSSSDHDYLPRFMQIGTASRVGTLIFLEDATATNYEAQQLKLASLGRLTASIAHEIRNPLGAISHAAELLGESPYADAQDRRLTEIIRNQSIRVNAIIENVLQLGRRDRSRPVSLDLGEWLTQFVNDYSQTHPKLTADRLKIEALGESRPVLFDPMHLQQILTNLCDNALRQVAQSDGGQVTLRYGGESRRRDYLEVQDNGPGIDSENQSHIFEPFYTQDSQGTGLGLYIARELAECNRAHLSLRESESGACFRLLFPEHKHQVS